jgi:hypothetical protein
LRRILLGHVADSSTNGLYRKEHSAELWGEKCGKGEKGNGNYSVDIIYRFSRLSRLLFPCL